jgi:hypothetical protein
MDGGEMVPISTTDIFSIQRAIFPFIHPLAEPPPQPFTHYPPPSSIHPPTNPPTLLSPTNQPPTTHPPTNEPTAQVNNLKRKYQREGIEDPEEILAHIARDLNMTLAKTTLVSLMCLDGWVCGWMGVGGWMCVETVGCMCGCAT